MPDLSKHTPPQFFVEPGALSRSHVFLTGDTLRHALTQRLMPGQLFRVVVDAGNPGRMPERPHTGNTPPNGCEVSKNQRREIEVATGDTEVIEAEVLETGRKRLVGRIRNRFRVKMPSYALHLYPAILKGDKFDLVINKATELGVTSITPVVAARTIPRLDENKVAARKARWRKVARAAAEQSGRLGIPEIMEVISFKELMATALQGIPLLAMERREIAKSVAEAVGSAKEVSIIIGPEGGFDVQEIELALEKGLCPVTLGPYILRAETASMAACAVIIDHMLHAGT